MDTVTLFLHLIWHLGLGFVFTFDFWQNYVIFDIIGEIIFLKNQSMNTWRRGCLIFKVPCCKSNSKNWSPSFHGINKISMFQHQDLFFRVQFIMNFFTPKFMKIGWPFYFFGSIVYYVWITLSTHDSNPTCIFANMRELNLFWLIVVLIQNSNTKELVKFL
jgi:hypothetical protein